MRSFLRTKIHNATVTEANIKYVGSITIDEALMKKADLREYEKVLVVSNNNGQRVETYVIKGPKNSGVVCTNGAASLLIKKGHEVIIMAFEVTNNPRPPRIVMVDKKNRFTRFHKRPH